MTFLNDRTEIFKEVAKEIETKYKLREAGKEEPKKIGISRRHENRPSATFINISTAITPLAKEMHSFRKMLDEKTQDYIFVTASYSKMTAEDRKELDEEITMCLQQFGTLINQLSNRINGSDGLKNAAEKVHLSRVHEFLQGYLKETTDYVAVLKREHYKRVQSKNKTTSKRIKDAQNDGYVFIYSYSLDEMAMKPKLNVSEKLLSKLHDLKNKHQCLQDVSAKPNNDFDVIEKWEENGDDDEGWGDLEEELVVEKEQVPPNLEQTSSEIRNRKKEKNLSWLDEEQENIRNSYEAWRSNQDAEFANQFQKQTEKEREEYIKSDKDDELEALEQQITEIQSLSAVFAEKIMDQERDIDMINDLALHTTENLVDGNEWIRKAITNSALRRVILLFCIIVLTFTLLFLDWYNP